jgi:hypothetical protein
MWEASTGWILANIAWWVVLWEILTYFWMSWEVLIILTAALILDWIFWVIDAYMKWTLESKLMARWLIKKLTRWCIPFIVIWVMRWAGLDNIEFIATSILSILIVAEWYSIIWHIYSINTWEELAEIDALKLLLQWIADLFKAKLEKKDKEE